MNLGARFGLWLGIIGVATAIAPMVLPRTWFGELGHGDGMGMIGLIMLGGIGVLAGLVIFVVSSLFGGKRSGQAPTDREGRAK